MWFTFLLTCSEMANNHIHCDCKVAWMKNFRALRNSDPILCTTPEALAGRLVDDLTYDELDCGKIIIQIFNVISSV